MITRRGFLAALTSTAAGLVLPWEPKRVYSFGEEVGLMPRIGSLVVFPSDPSGPRRFVPIRSMDQMVRLGPKDHGVMALMIHDEPGRFCAAVVSIVDGGARVQSRVLDMGALVGLQ